MAPHIGIREGRRVEARYSPCTDDILHVEGAAMRCRRVPLDAVVSEDAHAGAADWHHDSADLTATLKEPQPAATS